MERCSPGVRQARKGTPREGPPGGNAKPAISAISGIPLEEILPRLELLFQETSDASIREIRETFRARARCGIPPVELSTPHPSGEQAQGRKAGRESEDKEIFGPDHSSRVSGPTGELIPVQRGGNPKRLEEDGLRDLLNTRLMEVFKNYHSETAFALLYDINQRLFFYTIYSRTRRYCYVLDAADILQEVFLNIYRYPHRFKSEKPTSFRNWANTIIRNTILKNLKTQARHSRTELIGEELCERRDMSAISPLRVAMHEENRHDTSRSYLICLHLYLQMYNRLSAKERRALYLVEVRGSSYRDASDQLSIRLENLKMVIFRARKKIYRAMRKLLSHAT